MMARPLLNIKPGVYGDYDPYESKRYEFIQEIKKLGFVSTSGSDELSLDPDGLLYCTKDKLCAIIVEKNRFLFVDMIEKNFNVDNTYENYKSFLRSLKLKNLVDE